MPQINGKYLRGIFFDSFKFWNKDRSEFYTASCRQFNFDVIHLTAGKNNLSILSTALF
jgi:hypothetical protein